MNTYRCHHQPGHALHSHLDDEPPGPARYDCDPECVAPGDTPALAPDQFADESWDDPFARMKQRLVDQGHIVHNRSRRIGPLTLTQHRDGWKGEGWGLTSTRFLLELRPPNAVNAGEGGKAIAIGYSNEHNYVGNHEISAQFYLGSGHWIGWRFGW